MAAKKRLAEAEWEVMDGIWHLDHQVTVRDVVDYLYPNGEKAYGIVSWPTTFLIAPNGKIIVKNLRGEKLVDLVAEKLAAYK